MTNIDLGTKAFRAIAWVVGLWLKLLCLVFLVYGALLLAKLLGMLG